MRTARLADLYQSEGPFASVTIDVSLDRENADEEQRLHVRAAREALTRAGADTQVVETVVERLSEQVNEPAPVARTVVAGRRGVVFDETIHTRADQPVTSWGPLPDVTPWVEHEDSATRFVLAVVDHVGGDVATYTSDVPRPEAEASAGGETGYVQKVPAGGWSAMRYQRGTEEIWKENAEAVAEEILHQVRSGPRLVLLTGDPHSKAIIKDKLQGTPAQVVELAAGARSEDGGDESMQQAIKEALLEHTTARRLALTHALQDRLGQDRAVAIGVKDVADAFVRGQVETLLIDPQAASGFTVDPGEHPGLTLGAAQPEGPVPAHQAFLAAAAVTGAEVSVGRSSTLGGSPVAALLRWDQAAEGTR